MDGLRAGLAAIAAGLLDVLTFGGLSARHARELAGLDDPRPDDVKDAEAIGRDWAVVEDDVGRAMRNGTVIPDDFRRLGDAYGEYVKARAGRGRRRRS